MNGETQEDHASCSEANRTNITGGENALSEQGKPTSRNVPYSQGTCL